MIKGTIYLQQHVNTTVLKFLVMTCVHTLNSIHEERTLNYKYNTAKNSQTTPSPVNKKVQT